MSKTNIKYPCRNCVYFSVCGDSSRTEPCKGRLTWQGKKEENEAIAKEWCKRTGAVLMRCTEHGFYYANENGDWFLSYDLAQ